MRKREMRQEIKTVFSKLYDLFALYEETECFNQIPNGESGDVWEYINKKLLDIRKTITTSFLGERNVSKKLHHIADEAEHFLKICEIPGVVARWSEVNPKILFFECAFDLMEEDVDTYEKLKTGEFGGIHLAIYPDEAMIAEQKKYFGEIQEKIQEHNLQYSEERIFQNELLRTLRMVFEHDFARELRVSKRKNIL